MFFPGFQLESYMDEAFILKALQEVGEENVVSVKVCIGMCKSNYKLWYLCNITCFIKTQKPITNVFLFSFAQVIKNKFTGEPASYGFINFSSDHNALMAMHKLNGKVIPNSSPVSCSVEIRSRK